MTTTGERIRLRRKELGISVEDLAKMLNKNRATIYRYESDEIENMPITVLEPLAEALNVSPAYLMGWGNEQKTTNSTYFLNKLSDTELYDGTIDLIKKLDEHFPNDFLISKAKSTLSTYLTLINNLLENDVINADDRIFIKSKFPTAVHLFYSLNEDGKKLATDYLEMLSKNDKYTN